jgi:hypothetical protein
MIFHIIFNIFLTIFLLLFLFTFGNMIKIFTWTWCQWLMPAIQLFWRPRGEDQKDYSSKSAQANSS